MLRFAAGLPGSTEIGQLGLNALNLEQQTAAAAEVQLDLAAWILCIFGRGECNR